MNAESRIQDPGGTLVCFAMKEEAGPFQKAAAGRTGVSILITGIGRANTEAAVRRQLKNHLPQRVFTCGFAGGLNPALTAGAIVFSTDAANLAGALAAAGAKPAKIHCASSIATTVREKEELRRKTGADAVEMESEAVHAVCREHGIPCATLRVISDTAMEDLPLDFNQLAKPDMSLDFGKLAWAIVKSPGKIGALMRLQKKTRFAAGELARVLIRVMGPAVG